MVGWGSADFLAKLGVDRVGTLAALVWAHLFGAVTIVAIVLARDLIWGHAPHGPATPLGWLGLIAFGAGQAVVYLLVYRALERGRLSVLNPIFASYAAIAAVLAIIAFGDSASSGQLVALLALVAGVLLLSLDAEEGVPRRLGGAAGLPDIAGATALAALWTVLWDQMVSGRDWWTYAVVMYLAMVATLVALAAPARPSLRLPGRGVAFALLGIGLGEVVAYLSVSVGFAESSLTSVVAVLSGAFPIVALVLAYRFLGERLAPIQIAGTLTVVLATAAVVALA
jgi:drug/metabolite transporter (DMT)-like permease